MSNNQEFYRIPNLGKGIPTIIIASFELKIK